MDGAFWNEPQVPSTNVPYMTVSSSITIFLAIILLVYQLKFKDSPPIVSILALLLFNQLIMLLFQLPGYFAYIPNWVCLISITGTTFFRLAQYYWLFFVTRLLYRQKVAPGKFIDLSSYLRKNVLFTYIPSVIVTALVLIVANTDNTQSEANCWHLIQEKEPIDYIIYLSCFIVPNFIALVATLIYFIAFFFIKSKAINSLCIYFPITALPFMIYDLALRLLTFFGDIQSNELEDIPLVCHPLAHGIIFLVVLRNLSLGKRPTSSDLTIHQESQKIESFMIPHQEETSE